MTPNAKRTRNCPSCGFNLSKGQKSCPKCGKGPTKNGKKSETTKGKSAKTGKFECPSCGALIPKKSMKCPLCSADLLAASDKIPVQPVAEVTNEPKTELIETKAPEAGDEGKGPLCPSCASVLEGTESECPVCRTPLKGDRTTEEPPVPIAPGPVEEPPETTSVVESGDSRPCPSCDSVIPKGYQKCPICDASFIETTPQAEKAEPLAELAEVQPPEESTIPTYVTETRAAKPVRKRTLKSAKVTTVPAVASAKSPERTNGVRHVSGPGRASDTGMVNGTGAVNGTGFVNGSGVSSGSGGRAEAGAAKRTSKLMRWQLLAVLVAILVVIPVFVFLSYSDYGDRFSIDGDYGDWDGATTYGTKIQSTAPSSNITEWAVGTQSSDLFFYFRTETNMMSSPDVECYYLFVDSDGSNETGYVMESIGADYMLQLMGWDSEIKATSLLQHTSHPDQYDWNNWTSIDSLSCSLDGGRLEARAHMPEAVGQSAKFVLVSKDPADRSSVSYTAPLKGGVLVVRQAPSADVAATGVVSKAASVVMLTLRFSCEGEGGEVSQVNPVLVGAQLANQMPGFTLEKGGDQEMTVAVDTSTVTDGRLVSAEVFASSIVSTFAHVEIIGPGAKAYAGAAPSDIVIDGAFADWTGPLSTDLDPAPVINPGVDIDQVGNSSDSLTSYFYVSVKGEMCIGTFIPAMVTKPSGAGGGGVIVHTRITAEDILSIYVDSDKSNLTGYVVALDSKRIGADQKIEVRGLFGRITSTMEFDYSSTSDTWVESTAQVDAAKDEQRIEISVSTASLGASADIEFIAETTSWEGRSDLAAFDTSSTMAFTRTWIVEPVTTSGSATSMSHQRKIFYDGMNYWSFYFDGANTVYKYSSDSGVTWSTASRAFSTNGVNEVSVWYDSAEGIVYAVGDRGAPTRTVTIQRGVVDPATHTIAWSPTDAALAVSVNDQGDKNTFISKDTSGYLWILSSNNTGANPVRQDLSTFKSSEVDSVISWVHTGNLLGAANNQPNCKGSILPAGTGSDVYAIYAYLGNVASRKHTTTWSVENIIYAAGDNPANTDNAPPSAAVDSSGVVHVVYGTGRKVGPTSAPTIEYSHNNTDQTTFTMGVNLDPAIPAKVGDYYPTISLETSTGSLYALWLQSDVTLAPKTVMGRACVSGNWSEMTIEGQTTFTKQYLTSVYSFASGTVLCWQWTQNTTAPIQVLYDGTIIPEFSGLTPLVVASVTMFAVYRMRSRSKDDLTG
jgi:RNA polymerase subunit RPABC4/transcription elongation factor Spt4